MQLKIRQYTQKDKREKRKNHRELERERSSFEKKVVDQRDTHTPIQTDKPD